MSLDATFMKGGNLLRVCDVTLADGKTARVEPYAIYTSPKRRRHYLWFQIGSSDPDEAPGWKSPEASAVASVRLAQETFTVRRDYDPFDKQKLPVVHYSVPTHDGRQRWHDAGKYVDKQTIGNRPQF
ncbi:MAG TPA: hypothetical protein VN841_31340 [Bryobacteraceae bacterium]|nr:hypothetical protein [Bryobacteraceae bacterium]